MPPRIRTVAPQPTFEVDERTAFALRPEVERDSIPIRTTNSAEPVYAGEEREAQYGLVKTPVGPGVIATIVTLRRAWELVGFTVDPGNADAPLLASLRTLGRGLNGTIATVSVTNGLGPQSFVGFLVGARCELVVHNANAGPGHVFTGVRGEIWGMNLGARRGPLGE